jgi:Tol biopolymer transport system component
MRYLGEMRAVSREFTGLHETKRQTFLSNRQRSPPFKTLQVPPTASSRDFQFSVDGKSILFLDSRNGSANIWSQPLDAGQPKQITNFKANQIFGFAYSHDGKQLAFSRGEKTSDVVMISGFKK